MKKLIFGLLLIFSATAIEAQEVIRLFNENGKNATITLYKPENQMSDKAVVVCPGGGYGFLAVDHEGEKVARWLNSQGITAAVLRYTLPNADKDAADTQKPLEDAATAIKLMRQSATKWGFSAQKVGIIGFSAGGHLASTASTLYPDAESRPDFSILFYPVISVKEGVTHQGSRQNLIGSKPSAELINRFSNAKNVNSKTPPTFIALSSDDTVVVPQNSIEYYQALNDWGVPAEMHIYPTGNHGWGFSDDFKYYGEFTTSLARWLREL